MVLGTWAVLSRPDPRSWTGRSEAPSTLPPAVLQNPEADQAELSFHTHYARCGHDVSRVESAHPSPDPVRLELHYSDWELQICDDGFQFDRSFDQLCPNHLLVRREDGYLSVYQNREGCSQLSRIALFPDPLHEGHDQALASELEKGIVFDNSETLEHYLESLNS